ncbi:MAG TPA: FAD-dependent oxidoreductase [Actinophytocola sp.]|nr:FAD-dependent oxidoreductase [Actinophytocola sp.]
MREAVGSSVGNAGAVIVGASQAGLQLATSLRALDYAAPITLVGAEQHLPYQRPPLTKGFLADGSDAGSLAFRAASFYAERGIRVLLGTRVARVGLPASGGAGEAVTDTGEVLAFDALALTVGARPRRLAVPGADLDGVCYLRKLEDAVELRRRLATADRIVVVGGGFLGLEAAAVARSAGKTVTVVEAFDRLLARSVAPEVSRFYLGTHRDRGVDVRLGSTVCELAGAAGRVSGVVLADGSTLPADLVLVSVGVTPRTELAEQVGAECDRDGLGGIVVDGSARTTVPGVVAAGDCTVQPDPLTGRGRVRLESVHNAIMQAKVAAACLAGRTGPAPEVPWFWSDQYDLKLQIAGLKDGYDHHVLRGDPGSGRFSVLYYRDGALLGIDAVNRAGDYLAVRRALGRRGTIDPVAARDPGVALKDLVRLECPRV